ncbi:MAG: efflux RND transporter permease subunit, partial [bacterium]
MNVSAPAIRRPVATTLVMLGVAIFGVLAFRGLPVSDLPSVDFPTMNVTASLPGANPETMASAVATPLERQFSTIAGLDSMSSVSTLGNTQITLVFDLSRKINDVAPDVQSAIAAAGSLLPPGMPVPPTYKKVNPADQPILYLAITSKTMPLWDLDEYAETLMAQRISMIDGVAQVGVFGSQKYAVHVEVDPDAMASRGIGIDEVETAVRKANVNLPVGTVDGRHRSYTIRASGQLLDAAPYGDVVVTYTKGAPVRVRDIGRAVDGAEDDRTAAWFVDREGGSRRSLILAIQRQPGANTVAVADEIKQLLPTLQSYLPPAVELHVLYDRSISIRSSVREVEITLILSFVLVVAVVFLFLRNVSATVIPSLALPLSIVGTFAAMGLLGYTVDNLSMMALILAIGFVIDDAIVMLENIVRHHEMGERGVQAALAGSSEIGFTILSMTVSLAAVFIPILLMGGVIGKLFREFAVVICVAILLSGVVSLTLTPMLCSRFLRPTEPAEQGALFRWSERIFQAWLGLYTRSLDFVLRHRRATLLVNVAVLAVMVLIYPRVPKGFLPDEDNSQIFTVTETPQGTSFQELKARQQAVMAAIQDDPNIEAFFSNIGGVGSASLGGQNFGRMFLHLKPRDERTLDVNGVIAELRTKLAAVPGIVAYPQNPPTIRIGGQLTKSLYQFTLESPDLDSLYESVPAFEAKLRGLPDLTDVNSDLQLRNPQLSIDIDRDQAAVRGLTADPIESALANAYGPRWISTIYAPNNQYRVLLELDPVDRADPALLSKLYVRAASGALVPLDAVTRRRETVGPQAISHVGQLPAVTVSFNLKPGASLGAATTQVQQAARETLPPSISTSFQGSAQAFRSSLSGLGWLLLLSIFFIYLVLGVLYESFVHPLTILSGLPSAGFGALLTLWLFGAELNLYSFIGLIMLIGIVKKNAIMQIDFALEAQRTRGVSALEAIREGCILRFRPIMMTTMAALCGALPIAVGVGAGGGGRRALGLTVVGGLLTSQLITLYLTPVMFLYMNRAWDRLTSRGRRTSIDAGAQPASLTGP